MDWKQKQEIRKDQMEIYRRNSKDRQIREAEVLLPGLFDDIVLDKVVPKLPWTAFHTLSSVSRPWRQAIQRHLVYDARVRSHSTEMLVVLDYRYTENRMSLYSMTDNTWYQLPPFPKPGRSHLSLEFYQCLSLDGKIYIFGECYVNTDDDVDDGEGEGETSDVYVLDLIWQRDWKPCANIPQPRSKFGSAIVDGKIYVFGGLSDGKPVCESLVYDPEQNAWSSIMPMKHKRFGHHVVAVGEELFVHGGLIGDDQNEESIALCTEVYHAGRDEWRLLTFAHHAQGRLFTAQGNLHMMTPRAIYGNDTNSDQNHSWKLKLQHSFSSFSVRELNDPYEYYGAVEAIVEVENEILAVVSNDEAETIHLYRSKGFGSEKVDIVWERLCCEIMDGQMCPHVIHSVSNDGMCSIHL